MAITVAFMMSLGCSATPTTGGDPKPTPSPKVEPEAGFLVVPPREVTVKGKPVHVAAEGRLFYNLVPADDGPESKPILFLFNGFADDIVRPYGTGPMTVEEGGHVVDNPASFTRFANLVYLEPRQAGYSYDVLAHRAPRLEDCSPDVFNEYVDAGDMLLAALTFLKAHPTLTGPVYWVGESYAGVRITWILAYLRSKWSLVPYRDPLLEKELAEVTREASLGRGQILLEAWLAGGAHSDAILAACANPTLADGVAASIGAPCPSHDACSCAAAANRSPYDYLYPEARQIERELEADLAHTIPARAEALLGVRLAAIDGLAAKDRARGFKCSPPDETVPSDDQLAGELGALPNGQFYFVPYSPLEPGKELAPATLDWETTNLEGVAFVDALGDVPAMLTQGDRDLVVPTSALAPALRSIFGADKVHASPSRISIEVAGGERHVDVFDYPDAGHMVTMTSPQKFSDDLATWLAAH